MFSDHFGNPLEFEPAPLTLRGMAYIIDRIILVVFWILIIVGIVYLSHTPAGKDLFKVMESSSANNHPDSPVFQIFLTITIVLMIFAIYMIIYLPIALCEFFFKGISPGKLIFGLRIESTNGEAPSFIQILVRSLIRDIENTVGIIFIMATPQRQTFYDTLVGTVVVKYRRTKTSAGTAQPVSKKPLMSFSIPSSLQNQAFLWQRYYKLLTRSGHGGEHASRYSLLQARKELLRRLPLMSKHLPEGTGASDISETDTILRLFSDSLDANEVQWENH